MAPWKGFLKLEPACPFGNPNPEFRFPSELGCSTVVLPPRPSAPCSALRSLRNINILHVLLWRLTPWALMQRVEVSMFPFQFSPVTDCHPSGSMRNRKLSGRRHGMLLGPFRFEHTHNKARKSRQGWCRRRHSRISTRSCGVEPDE